MEKRNMIYVVLLISLLAFLIGCTKSAPPESQSDEPIGTIEANDGVEETMESEEDIESDDSMETVEEESENANWKDIELKDISTGESFKISDFEGKPVLLETFAVWCPTCKKQQDKIKELHEDVGDSIVSVSLDTDPNEDEAKVLEHVNKHGFKWRYAVSPVEVTQSLIDDFGIGIVNAPQAPVILICEDQSSRLLDRGVKDVEELKSEIEKGC